MNKGQKIYSIPVQLTELV